jgi:2-iminobutanoate/2-iminopropanoate deaminase
MSPFGGKQHAVPESAMKQAPPPPLAYADLCIGRFLMLSVVYATGRRWWSVAVFPQQIRSRNCEVNSGGNMQRQGINCPELMPPGAPFSHLVKTGSILYVSGQIAQDPTTGKLIDGDAATQTARILANIQAVLKSVDRDLRHVVKTTVFLTDMADYSEMNDIYAREFDPPYPARSTIAVKALPLGARVEIECVAQ